MYDFRTLSKAQLIELVNGVEKELVNSIQSANEAAKNYSDELPSRLAYEVGHLNGSIKQALYLIQAYKDCSK